MQKIRVLRKVKIDGKWLLLPVTKQNGVVDWRSVTHQGIPVVATGGTFYLQYRENGKKPCRAVGDHPRDAKAALISQQQVLGLRGKGMVVSDAPEIASRRPVAATLTGKTIADVIADFEKNPPIRFRKRSLSKYKNALKSFLAWTPKTHLVELDRHDVLDFMSFVVREGKDASTASDKGHIVHAIMNDHGATIRMKRGDWPKVTERQRQVYAPETLQKLFSAADEDDYTLFQTFLMSGFRDQEVGFLAWSDFNAKTSTLRVSKKPGMGFDPKNYEERTVPVPRELITLLSKHKKRQGGEEYLIFPTSGHLAHQGRPGGQRDKHMLDRLKRLAFRAGLNCKRCDAVKDGKAVSCKTSAVCKKFGLHMFRHTYATTLLRDGVDLLSLQKLLGHKDLDSTRIYLRSLEPEDLLSAVNRSSLATRFVA